MRSWAVIITFLVSFFLSSAAGAADCADALAGNLELRINLEVQFDEYGRPYLRLANAPAPAPPQPRGTTSRHSLVSHFEALTDRGFMLNQQNWRLAHRGLIVPNGGLCASTCGANVLTAAASYLGLDTVGTAAIADLNVHRMVEFVWNRYGADGRIGMHLEHLGPAIEETARQLGMRVRADFTRLSGSYGLDIRDLVPTHNELIIASIESGWKPEGIAGFHAIVLVQVDPRGSVRYSDPNNPHYLSFGGADHIGTSLGVQTVRIGYPSPQPTFETGGIFSYLRVRVY